MDMPEPDVHMLSGALALSHSCALLSSARFALASLDEVATLTFVADLSTSIRLFRSSPKGSDIS